MKIKNILPVALALGCALASGAAFAEPVRIGLAAEPYPPFTWKDSDGVWKGFEIDLAKAVCEKEALDCQLVDVAYDGIIPALNSQKIDVILASMTITDKRLEVIDFSNPYYSAPGAFIAPEGTVTDGTPASVSGKIIGAQISTTYSDFAENTYGDVADIRLYSTQDSANSDLMAGRIDMIIAGKIPMSVWLQSEQGKGFVVAGDVPFAEGSIQRIGFGLRKGSEELKDKLNKGLATVLADGTYDRIAQTYFDFDIYGLPRN